MRIPYGTQSTRVHTNTVITQINVTNFKHNLNRFRKHGKTGYEDPQFAGYALPWIQPRLGESEAHWRFPGHTERTRLTDW